MFNFFKNIVDWISEKLNKEGIQKTVTAVLLATFMVVMLCIFENNIINRFDIAHNERETELVEEHKELYAASMDMYSQIKSVMRLQRPETGADYILLLEYHNGSENIATGYQFCKFDVTIEELSDSVPYIQTDKFKDENLYKYDILLSDKVTKSKMSYFTWDDVVLLDRNMIHTLNPNDNTQQIVFYNITYKKMTAGTLMFMYAADRKIDYTAITNCATDIEQIIRSAMHKREMTVKNRKR